MTILASAVPFPLLLLLASLLLTPAQSSSPNPYDDSLNRLDPRAPIQTSIPLYRRSTSLRKRASSTELTQAWALKAKHQLTNKYGAGGGDTSGNTKRGLLKVRQMNGPVVTDRTDRLETPIAIAGYNQSVGPNATTTRNASTPTSTPSPTNPVGQAQVWNYDADLAYYAVVGVGSPPQFMNVILDTGSADLWIAGAGCTNLTGCDGIPLLNETSSNSSLDLTTSFSVRYGSGSAAGDLYKDYVGFAGYNVSNQTFAVVDTISNDLLNGDISGLYGLGWQGLAASGATPFWQNLYNAGVLPFPGFAVQLTRFVNVSSASTVEPGGSLTFGYLNTSLYQGDIHYINIPNGMESYWVVPMDAVNVNGTNVTMTEIPMVAIDTGTTLIGGPASVVSQIYAEIPGALAATGDYIGYYSYPCATQVNISLAFGNMTWNISSDDFNLGPFGTTNNISTCLGAFFDLSLSSSSRISWVIGAAFLKNVFSVFRANPPSVGFALLSNGSSTYNSTNNGTMFGNGTRDSNLTSIPVGIYGPVGGTTSSPSPTPTSLPVITTAIEAGQTGPVKPSAAFKLESPRRIMSVVGLNLGILVLAGLSGWVLVL